MSVVDHMMPARNNRNGHGHADIMNDFLAASASDEARASYRPGHVRSRSANSQTSQRSSAEHASLPAHEGPSLGLRPPMPSRPRQSRPSNTYQDTQSAQPSFPSSNPMSPSLSSFHDQATPDPWLSDPSYTDISQYTTPGIDEDLLGTMLDASFTNFSNYSAISHGSSGQASNFNPSNTNLQAPSFATSFSGGHLMSPSLTNLSSPASSTDNLANPSLVSAPLQNTGLTPGSFTTGMEATYAYEAVPEQQRSPALSSSSGEAYLGGPQSLAAHLVSPVVRVENYSRDESPARAGMDRTLSKRSHGSRRSATHLSPYDAEESSNEGSERSSVREILVRPIPVATPQRGDDGSWMRNNSSGQAGISPEDRNNLKDDYIPNLKEQEDRRLLEEKNHEVQEWLTKSEVGSEAGDSDSHPRSTRRPRARSTNDMISRGQKDLGVQFPAFRGSHVPGPGLNIDVESEDEETEGSSEGDEAAESPPADVQVDQPKDVESYFPRMLGTLQEDTVPEHTRPWRDPPNPPEVRGEKYQPDTSNAAMQKFLQRSRDIETASLAATLGSQRRRSESEIGSLFHATGTSNSVVPDADTGRIKEKRPRKGSILDNILPKRTPSNLLKRKGSHPTTASSSQPSLPIETKAAAPPRRTGSWGRPKSPQIDTSPVILTRDGGLGTPALNPSATSPLAYARNVRNVIRRNRSRSDIGKTPGLSELMRTHGGPPTLSLVTPTDDPEAINPSLRDLEGSGDDDDADYEDGGQEPVTMDLKVRSDPIIPHVDGFRDHARQLNPRLDEYMIERVAQEQNRRYKRLLEMKLKHIKVVGDKNCSSKGFCTALGGKSKILPPRMGNKNGEPPSAGFQVAPSSDDGLDQADVGTLIPAQFPTGVPRPPVKRLPAEFECPLCFKVKKFYKPSDWTKHVHEDVQPFTCTFPNCQEPKSFKRKADWVRHENERHRKLESWRCDRQDCGHTCYRKDNFVQHLVREHKVPEPKARTSRSANGSYDGSVPFSIADWRNGSEVFAYGAGDASDKVWALVEACHHDTTKQPRNEPCRFCGNVCNSWKKLTVHLAKHMEQISMPILPLVESKPLDADTIISPIEKTQPQRARATSSATASTSGNASRYNQSLGAGTFSNASYSSSFSQDTAGMAPASTAMHSYPPPRFQGYGQQPQLSSYPVDPTQSYAIRSYPGVQPHAQFAANQYGRARHAPSITPVTDCGQQQVFDSPVEGPSFGSELPTSLYAHNDGWNAATAAENMQGGQHGPGAYQQMAGPYLAYHQGA